MGGGTGTGRRPTLAPLVHMSRSLSPAACTHLLSSFLQDIPAVQHPTVFVYHPTEGHAFANVGFVGWIGALSGQSSVQMSIHEIGVSYPDSTFGNESFAGIPFVFLLRDILQFDNTYNDTIQRITTANRTCDLILGVGDGKAGGAFRAFEYSASVANVFDDTNQMPLASWHPRIPNVVYYGACPAHARAAVVLCCVASTPLASPGAA